MLAGFSCGCSVTKQTVLRPNHVLIESNNAATIPIAAKLAKKRGYVPVTDRALAQNVLTITVETGFRPYASSRFTDREFAHSIPVSLKMTNRQGLATWTSQSMGESDNASEALRIAVRDAIEGYTRRNAGLWELLKTPMDALLGLKRPTELPPYSP